MNNMQNDKIMKHPNTTRENKPIFHNRNLRIINNSNSNNSSSNNFFQMKKYKIKKNDKNAKLNFELVKKNIIQKLKNNLKKYDSSIRKVNIKTINDIIYDERKHIVSVFKDYLFWDENSDFLKRFYKIHESRDRMPRISAYYQTYTLIRPIYFKLECYKLLNKNLKRHKKRLEILEEKLNNNNAKNKNHNNDNDNENSKNNKNKVDQSDEFSKIVKSHYIQTENITEINLNNNNYHKNDNEKDLCGVNDNRNLNNFLNEKKNEPDFIVYGEKSNKENNNYDNNKFVLIDNDNYKNIGIRRMIKLKDVGNKYNIEKYQLEENENKNLIKNDEMEQNQKISNNKLNNSFSFLELENLLDLNQNKENKQNPKSHNKYQTLNTRKANMETENNYINTENSKIIDKKIINNKNQNNLKNSNNLYSNTKSDKFGKKGLNNFDNNKRSNKDLLANESERNKQKIVITNLNFPNKKEEMEETQHSLFMEDYSIIQSEKNDLKDQAFSQNFINFPTNDEHSFLVENNKNNIFNNKNSLKESSQMESIISSNRNNDKKNEYILDSQLENKKLIVGAKDNNVKFTSKEKENQKVFIKTGLNSNNANITNNNYSKQATKDVKKIKIPTLNFENINVNNNQNLNCKTGKTSNENINKTSKNQQALESRKLSEPIKKDNKYSSNNITNKINLNNNKEYRKMKSEPTNNLLESNSKIIKDKSANNNKDELNNSKSEKEMENKTNQNFKIIENMIKSIKMNNIDNLIKIIDSKSKNKNKALTSREKDRGDILILQNIYSRNLNKDKLIDNCDNYNTHDKKSLSDKYISNNIEKSKLNENENNLYNNLIANLNSERNLNEINPEGVYENYNNKNGINTITEPNLTNTNEIIYSPKKNITKKSTTGNQANINNGNYLSSRNSKDGKNKEIREKEILSNYKNNINANRNLLSSASNKNNYNSASNSNNNKMIISANKANNKNLENSNYNNNNNNPSSIYNINLNLNLNLNVKMDKSKNSESTNTANTNTNNNSNKEIILNQTTKRNISSALNNENTSNNPINNTNRNLFNKENRILIKKASEEDIYKNLKNSKHAADVVIFEPGSLTDRQRKDYFNFEELQIKSIVNEKESETNYINTEDNLKNYSNQFDKINFVNKLSYKNGDEKNQQQNNLNNFLINNSNNNNNQFQNNFNTPHNLSRNVYNSNNLKLKLRSEDQNLNNNNIKNPNNNFNTDKIFSANLNAKKQENFNSINNNYNSSNFAKKILEEEKKSRNVQNNNLVNPANFFMNNNQIQNNNIINKNTLSSKLRNNQPLTHRVSEANKNINDNMHSDSTKNLNIEKKVVYKSEKSRIANPLVNSNNINNKINSNIHKNIIGNNLNMKIPSGNQNKININNLVKNVNLNNYNSERSNYTSQHKHYIKNPSEKDIKNQINTNSNIFSSIDIQNSSNNNFNNLSKRENLLNRQNYESLNSNQNMNSIHNNNHNDISLKSPNLLNDESYLRIIQNTEKKFNSISRNFNLKNLILFNDTTNINKMTNPISLKNNDTYGKNIYTNNTARNNSASNNLNYENYLINKNENSGLFTNQQNNKIYVDKNKYNTMNSQNINNNNNYSLAQKSLITTYNDRNSSSCKNDKTKAKITQIYNSEKNNKRNNNENTLYVSGDIPGLRENSKINNNYNNPNKNNLINIKKNNLIVDNINNDINKPKIKIPILNLKDINKYNNEDYDEVDERQNLTSARNNKNTINEFLTKNINMAVNSKEYLTLRNEKNISGNKNDLINNDLNSHKKGVIKIKGSKNLQNQGPVLNENSKNIFLKNNFKMVVDSKNNQQSSSNREFFNNPNNFKNK